MLLNLVSMTHTGVVDRSFGRRRDRCHGDLSIVKSNEMLIADFLRVLPIFPVRFGVGDAVVVAWSTLSYKMKIVL